MFGEGDGAVLLDPALEIHRAGARLPGPPQPMSTSTETHPTGNPESERPASATPRRKLLVILNPVAGQGDFSTTRSRIEQHFQDAGCSIEIRETEGEGDALTWAREATGFDFIVVGGGDGTVMEAMTGMIKNPSPVPLAQIPLGTANLLTRAFAIPGEIDQALELITGDTDGDSEAVIVKIDVGHLRDHDRYFAIVAGAGWDANLIADASREMKNRLGFLAYVVTGIKHLFGLRTSRIEIDVDGEIHRGRANSVMVINVGEIHGTGIAIGENVSPHDGKLDLAIASPRSLLELLRILWRLVTRRFGNSGELRYFSASRIRVQARPPMKLEIDGDVIGETPFDVEVVPDGARLLVTREYAEAKGIPFDALKRPGP